jgi:hypothetical protein
MKVFWCWKGIPCFSGEVFFQAQMQRDKFIFFSRSSSYSGGACPDTVKMHKVRSPRGGQLGITGLAMG